MCIYSKQLVAVTNIKYLYAKTEVKQLWYLVLKLCIAILFRMIL